MGMLFVFFKDTATTEIYTLSLHDALPISRDPFLGALAAPTTEESVAAGVSIEVDDIDTHTISTLSGNAEVLAIAPVIPMRSEEHTSELQSRQYLVCRLLLEKKKDKYQAKK